jgi:dTDP-glucose pyrophosphorylase
MAGHSRRFHEAGYEGSKALLPVGEQPMIEHVVNMFDPKGCRFHIVINRDQAENDPNLIDYLSNLASRVSVVVVESHELGPVHSALQVKGIDDDEEVIVSYCDFIVQWDFHLFLRQVQGYDGGIASFRGFHPASFGDTHYAYMRVDNQNRLLELREKRSFTDQRHEEHASAGIYYFRNWLSFRHYGRKQLEKGVRELPEVYASLLYNGMVADGLEIIVHETQKFLCLGTPSDMEQYQFWWRYFSKERSFDAHKTFSFPPNQDESKRIGLVPIAGRSNRFREYGYRVVKPLISVLDAPMVVTAVRSMPHQTAWIFVARQDDLDRHPILSSLRDFNAQSVVIGAKEFTSGQAATCMLAADYIDDDAELMIASCDYATTYDSKSWNEIRNNSSIDGAIWTVRTKGLPIKNPDAFAYCKVRADGKTITQVVEKATISDTPNIDPLVVGTFWYRRALDFKRGATHLITNDITVKGEHYVATSINYLIDQGARFVIFDLEQWISFGDPFELKIMEYWNDYFLA